MTTAKFKPVLETKKDILDAYANNAGILSRIRDDEPIFILRAQDVLAPDTVEYWARRLYEYHLNVQQIDTFNSAIHISVLMRDYQNKFGSKIPD